MSSMNTFLTNIIWPTKINVVLFILLINHFYLCIFAGDRDSAEGNFMTCSINETLFLYNKCICLFYCTLFQHAFHFHLFTRLRIEITKDQATKNGEDGDRTHWSRGVREERYNKLIFSNFSFQTNRLTLFFLLLWIHYILYVVINAYLFVCFFLTYVKQRHLKVRLEIEYISEKFWANLKYSTRLIIFSFKANLIAEPFSLIKTES
jgi:hypothetical protein